VPALPSYCIQCWQSDPQEPTVAQELAEPGSAWWKRCHWAVPTFGTMFGWHTWGNLM